MDGAKKDDSPLLNTTLNEDITRLHSIFGLDLSAIDEIILNGVRHSFLHLERKISMEAELCAEMVYLRRIYGLENI